jgi:hypothetical protein
VGGGVNPPVTFIDTVLYCAEQPELVTGFERLTGKKLRKPQRSALERLIDNATGNAPGTFDPDGVIAFADFVHEFVWSRLPDEAFAKETT